MTSSICSIKRRCIYLCYSSSSYRGQSSEKTSAFRKVYAQVGHLRSVLKPVVVVVGMTATIGISTQMAIVDALQMRNAVLIQESPIKDNIKHVVLSAKVKDIEEPFSWHCNEVYKRKKTWNA